MLPVLSVGIVFFSCTSTTEKRPVQTGVETTTIVRIDTFPHLNDLTPRLRNGDIIFRLGRDVISSLFAQFNRMDKRFSHAGILIQDKGSWRVYHALGGEGNPNACLRNDAVEHFVSPRSNLGFAVCRYPLTPHQTQTMKAILDSLYSARVPFDMDFDLKSHDRLYCAEMVSFVYGLTIGKADYFPVSEHKGFRFIATENLTQGSGLQWLGQVVY